MDKVFLSVIFLSDNPLVKLKLGSLLLSEQDSWEIYLVGIWLTVFADGYLGEKNFIFSYPFSCCHLCHSLFLLLTITLLTLSPVCVLFPQIYSVALSHLSLSLFLFFNIFKTLPNPGLLCYIGHMEELSSNVNYEEKPEL